MSEEAFNQYGEFGDVNPDELPDPPSLPVGQDIVFEVTKAERKVTEKEGNKSIRVAVQVKSPDIESSPVAFGSLWVTSKFKAKETDGHRSFAMFLKTLGLPYTTQAQDLVGLRFVGQAQVNRQNADFYDLSKVVGKA